MHKFKWDKKAQGKLYSDCSFIYFLLFFSLYNFLSRSIKMPNKGTLITRKNLILTAKYKGIKKQHKMSTSDLINALSRHDSKCRSYPIRRKIWKIYPKFVKKQNILEDDLRKVTMLQNMSHDDLKKIAKLWNIKNYNTWAKEDLIYILLRSEKNLFEDNYTKCISNNTTDELRSRRNNIRKDLYEIENKQKPTKTQKERYYRYLIELANTLNKNEEYKHSDYNDLDYFVNKGRWKFIY